MAQHARTRFTPEEAMYYLKARPQFSDISEQKLIAAIAAITADSASKELSLVNLAQLENSLIEQPSAVF